jgi:hypothetical protein
MEYVGIDLHKKESQICLLTEAGEVMECRIRTEPQRFAAVLGGRPRARILVEASTESEWVARCLEALGHEVVAADPNFALIPPYGRGMSRGEPGRCDRESTSRACGVRSSAWRSRTEDRGIGRDASTGHARQAPHEGPPVGGGVAARGGPHASTPSVHGPIRGAHGRRHRPGGLARGSARGSSLTLGSSCATWTVERTVRSPMRSFAEAVTTPRATPAVGPPRPPSASGGREPAGSPRRRSVPRRG